MLSKKRKVALKEPKLIPAYLDEFNLEPQNPSITLPTGVCTVRILEVQTGEVRELVVGVLFDKNNGQIVDPYPWAQGNASCDCNRGSYFLGLEGADVDCGEGAYLVNMVNPKTGRIFYQEWEETDV